MSGEALTRYYAQYYDNGEDVWDDMVLANDAAREIERLEKLSVEREAAVWGEVDDKIVEIERLEAQLRAEREAGKQAVNAITGLEAQVRELEGILSSNENWATVAQTIEKQYIDKVGHIEQERDRLRDELIAMSNKHLHIKPHTSRGEKNE